jgi:hypothetical protein
MFTKNNTYIDISTNSPVEIKAFLRTLKLRYDFVCLYGDDIDHDLSENSLTLVLNDREGICYFENERYPNSISIIEFKKIKFYN